MLEALKNPHLKQLLEKGSPEWAKDVRKKAKTLAGQIDTSYLDLAEVLWEIHDTHADGDPNRAPVYQAFFNYDNFGQFCEEELNIHKDKAKRLLRIWEVIGIELAHIPSDVKAALISSGFSKLKELTRVLTPTNAAGWAEKATKLSYPKLYQTIQAYNDARNSFKNQIIAQKTEALKVVEAAKAGEDVSEEDLSKAEQVLSQPINPEFNVDPKIINPDTSTSLAFSLYPDQYQIVMDALTAASKLSNSVKKSHNLSLICMDFLAVNVFKGSDNVVEFLAKLESILGLKLIALDSDSDSVVYGAKHVHD